MRHFRGLDDGEEAQAGAQDRARTPNPGALGEFRANLDEIASLLQARGVGLLVLNLPSVVSDGPMTAAERSLARAFPEVENLALFEDAVRGLCGRPGASCLLDALPLEESGKGGYFYDHYHPNAQGNAILAQRVLSAIEGDPALSFLFYKPTSHLDPFRTWLILDKSLEMGPSSLSLHGPPRRNRASRLVNPEMCVSSFSSSLRR